MYQINTYYILVCAFFDMIEVNECSGNPCDTNGLCDNTDISFTCTCEHGYTGDGFTCAGNNLLKCYVLLYFALLHILYANI